MRHLARHCTSNQSSGPRTDTRTGQIMPHRRSSDVASAVWLIVEESISRIFTSPSVMGVTNQSVLAPASAAVILARTAYPQFAGNVTFRQSQSTVGPLSPVIMPVHEFGRRVYQWLSICQYGGKPVQLFPAMELPRSLNEAYLHVNRPMMFLLQIEITVVPLTPPIETNWPFVLTMCTMRCLECGVVISQSGLASCTGHHNKHQNCGRHAAVHTPCK